MSDYVIGIDLGTTNSCVSIYQDKRVKILEDKDGKRITPSYLFFTEKDAVIVGHHAKKMAENRPEYGVYEIKRLVGRKCDYPYLQNNLHYFPFKIVNDSNDPVIMIERKNKIVKKTPQELCTLILKKIKTDVETKLGQLVNKVVITVPAYFNVPQREVTLAAAKDAGFEVLKLLNEPTAAALSFFFENKNPEESYSLVYDLGGGTFDVAILKRNSGKISIICVDGDSHLGGQDFDNLIIDYVCGELREHHNYNPKTQRRALRKLRNECEETKQRLSTAEEASIVIDGLDDDVEITLTRLQFEEMADKLFKKTITIVDNCLKSSKLPKTAIKEVILSGGSTRIPKIQQLLTSYFDGKALNHCVNPDECVAEGAALQAAMLSDNPEQAIDEIKIIDVTCLSLGVKNFVDMMTFLIKRNTTIPASESSTRVTVYNRQQSMTFDVYEGERVNAKKNRFLGKLTIENITPAPPGQCEVTFTMIIDQNGILTITAKERHRDNVRNLKIDYTTDHRSDSEVKNAVKDAEDNKEEDMRFRSFACLKEFLLSYCIKAVYNFECRGLVESYKNVYELCKTTKAAAGGLGLDDEAKIREMVNKVKQQCGPIVLEHKFDYMPSLRK